MGTCPARDKHPARRSEKLGWWRGSLLRCRDSPRSQLPAPAAAFGRWLLLAEGPFSELPSLVAGRSLAGGSYESLLRFPLTRSCCQVIKTLTGRGSVGWDRWLKLAKQRCQDARNPLTLEGHCHHAGDLTSCTTRARCGSAAWETGEGLSLPVFPVEPQPSSPGD